MTPTQLVGRLISIGVCPERIRKILLLKNGWRVLYGIGKQMGVL